METTINITGRPDSKHVTINPIVAAVPEQFCQAGCHFTLT